MGNFLEGGSGRAAGENKKLLICVSKTHRLSEPLPRQLTLKIPACKQARVSKPINGAGCFQSNRQEGGCGGVGSSQVLPRTIENVTEFTHPGCECSPEEENVI